jgi:tRNA dimethylallyltransferase
VLKQGTKATVYKDEYRMFVLDLPREELYKRIDSRVDEMVKKGLVEEVKSLINKGVNTGSTAMQAIGYKEIAGYLRERCSLKEAIDQIKQATRYYAKRQGTWFKNYKEAIGVNVLGKSAGEIAGAAGNNL